MFGSMSFSSSSISSGVLGTIPLSLFIVILSCFGGGDLSAIGKATKKHHHRLDSF
jgi:hypothetical protein